MSKPFDIEIASLTDALDPRCAPALHPRSDGGDDSGAKSFYIETFGCQMNVHDSEKVAGVLLERGYRAVETAADADFLLYNTCSIREKAAQKVFQRLNDFKFAAKANQKVIGVLGCVAQQEGEEIFERAPWVSLVCGSASYRNLPNLIEQV
jgi:tRNA-2-methylthio-N6-dimethylallyladenosine synthase